MPAMDAGSMDIRRRDLLRTAALCGMLACGRMPARAGLPAKRPRLAVALGSGSMHGLAHIGVVRAFEELALVPDLIVGSSAGAVVGALWAAGVGSARMEAMAQDTDFTALGSPVVPWRAFMHNRRIERMIDEAVGGRPIEQLPIRFAAVATALDDGSRVTLARGRTGLVVAASSAIPVLYKPVRVDGRELIDGSLSAPVPVDAARELGADVVLAVDVAYRPDEAPARHIVDMAFQTLHILINALAAEQLVHADVALRLSLHELMLQHDAPLRALVDAGRRSMLAKASVLRRMLQRAQ